MVTRNRNGFTLTEMLLTVAIIGILAAGLPALISQLVRFYYLHTAKIEIQKDARTCLENINRFLRQAESSSVVIDQVNSPQQPPFSRISFSTIGGQSMSFYQMNNKLMQVGVSTSTISSNLRYIAFTYPRSDDPSIISVAITMEKATYQGASKALELSIEKVRVMN